PGRRAPVPRGDGSARPESRSRCPCACPAHIRRMAAMEAPPDRGPRSAAQAREMLVSIGAEAFAERTRRELLATGERVRKRNVTTRDDLTPQETQIAQLAAE